MIRSVTRLFLISLYLSFLFSNLLAVTSQPVELKEGTLVEGKGESTRLATAADFQGRC